MKIQCDVCENALATVICCADEAALCAKCDVEIHAANKLASKHKRLLLDCLSNKLPLCDICQEKPAFIFCVEDRALLCRDCDEPIHSANNLACNHQRFLATGIRVALSSNTSKEAQQESSEIPKQERSPASMKRTTPQTPTSPSWAVDDFLRFDDFDSNNKKEDLGFGELDWLNEIGLFGHQEPLDAGEVPQLPIIPPFDSTIFRPSKHNSSVKKPRIETPDEEFFTVPDLG